MMELPKTPSLRLDGKRALVTGGSSGIGLGSAVALADAGAHVVVAARNAKTLEQVVNAINESGNSAEALVMDVSSTDSITEGFKAQAPFDVVVNSAGAAVPGPALDTSPETFQQVMDTNVRGAYFVSVGAAHGMIQQGNGGSIIHISSQMGHVGGIDRTVYCASKHAVEGMVKAMAIEWGPYDIRVNTISPTFIKTPLTEVTFNNPERVAWIKSKIKLDRIGEIEDIMGSVLYLATSASAMVTGTSLLVDGGWTAG
ncbi:3-oxoacyl-ACP reductase [Chromatiales bacterium (ex Bugula neritina AB1)]|nr:3-oxoacyl-ACP reductase [Chromatiales bacterium (ex Bugula neritina AB1)]